MGGVWVEGGNVAVTSSAWSRCESEVVDGDLPALAPPPLGLQQNPVCVPVQRDLGASPAVRPRPAPHRGAVPVVPPPPEEHLDHAHMVPRQPMGEGEAERHQAEGRGHGDRETGSSERALTRL